MKKLLNNIHNILTWRYGQNYTFNACMGYLMECMNERKEYDYWFFSGVTGDSFTQVYCKDYSYVPSCLSQDTFDVSFAKKAFGACGYEVDFWDEAEISTNFKVCIETIVAFIDNGKPVITKGVFENGEFCVICGYDTESKKFYILSGEENTPKEYDYENVLNCSKALLFVGPKTLIPELGEVYRKAVMNIPVYITMPSTNELSFGKQAFEEWANSFQNGFFDNIPVEDIDPWRIHGTYLCMAGTNGCSRGFLKKTLELNPDMDFINELEPIYAKHGVVFEDLAYRDSKGGLDYANGGMEGGFNIVPVKIKSKEIMRPISDKILESAKYCDEILALFDRLK